MSKIIKMTLEEAMAHTPNEKEKAAWTRFQKMTDADIDYSDIPEITDSELKKFKRGGARPGAGRKPVKHKKEFSTLTVSKVTANEIRSLAKANRQTIDEFLRRRVA